jgi:hypothetical protein
MAQRTYLIGLYFALSFGYRYVSRWLPKIEQNASAEQFTCILAVLNALQECLPLIAPGPPNE